MERVKVCSVDELSAKSHVVIRLVGRLVGIIRRADGSLTAIEAGCKHQGANLFEHYDGGLTLVCPRHQWEYDIASGECLNNDSVPLRKYQVTCQDGEIWVSLLPIE